MGNVSKKLQKPIQSFFISPLKIFWRFRKTLALGWIIASVTCLVLSFTFLKSQSIEKFADHAHRTRVFVNYVYSGEGKRQDSSTNLAFFLKHGVNVPNDNTIHVDYGITVNGRCAIKECRDPSFFTEPNDKQQYPNVQVLNRNNSGFDFGGHAAMLEELDSKGRTNNYDAFVFLNDGVVGPIVPSYMPKEWHWTRAFLDRITSSPQEEKLDSWPALTGGGTSVTEVGLVATSIVCLSKGDLGGRGPKVEGFAFAISQHALEIVRTEGTSFRQHGTKVAAILSGEYNLTSVLLMHSIQIDTLLKSYQGIDWNNQSNWECNSKKHPTRKNTYFGNSINPLEVIFHKLNWAGQKPVNKDVLEMYMQFQDELVQRNKRKERKMQ